VGGSCAQAQQTKQPPKALVAPYTIPEDAVHQADPVQATPESIAHGKKWYGYDCAMSQGKDGDDKGEVAADMKLKVSDFTEPATRKKELTENSFTLSSSEKATCRPKALA
jgi:hypothetical protein